MFDISVIIPVYNRPTLFNRAIDSILQSSHKSVEIIIVDDGSTDNTLDIAAKYADRYPQIKLIVAAHAGPGTARNLGLANAAGRYIAFLDSDDFVPPQAYAKMLHLAQTTSADIIVGKLLRKINDGQWQAYRPLQHVFTSSGEINLSKSYDIPIINPGCYNKLYNKKFLLDNAISFPPEVMMEDYVFSIKAFIHSERVFPLNEAVYCYETNNNIGNSTTISYAKEIIMSGFSSFKYNHRYFKKRQLQGYYNMMAVNNIPYLCSRLYKCRERFLIYPELLRIVNKLGNDEIARISLENYFKIPIHVMSSINSRLFFHIQDQD